jgi:hypothetical protein
MKFYVTAAYLRKHSALPEIRSATNVRNPSHSIRAKSDFICVSQLQTTVYTSCGRCGKAILAQQGGSMCATCRSPAAQCSIWYVFFIPFYYYLFSFLRTIDSKHILKPPPSKIHALPVRHMLARRSPSLLPPFLRRNTVSSPSSPTTSALARIPDEIPFSSLPFGVGVAKQRQRRR